MGAFFSYSLASSIIICLGYLAYKWILAGERQHACNRVALYSIYFLALSLPFLSGKWSSFISSHDYPQSAVIEIGTLTAMTGTAVGSNLPPASHNFISIPVILTAIYFIGMAMALIYTLNGAFQLISIIRNGEKFKQERFTLVITDRPDVAPFSWLNYYVMSREDYESAGNVISIHERRHLQLLHWIDLSFVQAMCIFQWFNPAAWLMGEEFKTVHEYQADEAVMKSGSDLKQYQLLLIRKAVGTRFQALANSLNHSKLKKRVTMMYKSKSSRARRLSALLLVPAIGIGCAVIEIPAVAAVLNQTSEISLMPERESKVNNFSSNSLSSSVENVQNADLSLSEESEAPEVEEISEVKSENVEATPVAQEAESLSTTDNDNSASLSAVDAETPDKKRDEVYVAVEQPAEFPGGMAKLMNYLSESIRYPENAIKNEIQGKVVVKFVVEKDGSIGDASVLKGIDPELDNEAIRVIKSMPAWIPGKNNGEDVASFFNLPVTFKLKGDKDKEEKKAE